MNPQTRFMFLSVVLFSCITLIGFGVKRNAVTLDVEPATPPAANASQAPEMTPPEVAAEACEREYAACVASERGETGRSDCEARRDACRAAARSRPAEAAPFDSGDPRRR